jgi:hypothetical protein
MPVKSFIGAVEETARRWYATALRGEISDANVQGYLRAASQIADVWQQIDQKVAEAIRQRVPAWEAYAQMRYPLAVIRAARTYQVFVEQLLAADAAADPATADYLPRVTYDQANALCHQIQPHLQHAVAALNDPTYQPGVAFPLELGPRIEAEGAPCPVAHLQGMIAAAREVREWAAGLIAEYSNAISAISAITPPSTTATPTTGATGATAQGAVPKAVTAHITELNSLLAQADSQFQFGADLVGQVSQGTATPELHEEAENNLWEALRLYFLLNQAVALPEALQASQPRRSSAKPAHLDQPTRAYRDRPIRPQDLWGIAAPSARSDLRGTEFGTDEMVEMCEKMGGVLSAGAQQYLDDVEAAVARGDITLIAAMANCPFEPVYRARRPLELAGARVPATYEFHWNFHRGHIESQPRFGRVDDWQECEE